MEAQTEKKKTTTTPHYTVFIKLPFKRNGFVDPPAVDWTPAKDDALWKVLSRPTGQDIDWKALADHFNVSLPFLLQQAAWLYDRQLSQVRAQIRRVGTKSSLRPASSGSVAARPNSGGGGTINARNSNENLTISKVRAAAVPSPTTTGGVNPAPLRRNVSSGSSASLLLRNATANRGAVELKSGGGPGTPGSAGVVSTSPQQQQQHQQQATIHPPQPPPLETRPSFLDAPSDVEEEGSTEFPSESDRNDGNGASQRHAASADATATASSKCREPETGMRKLRHFDMLSQSRPRMRMSYANSQHRKDYISIRDDEEENQPAFLPHSDNYDDSNEEEDEENVPSPIVYDDLNATILGSSEQRPGNQEERQQQQQQQRNLTIDTALTTTSVTAEHGLSTASTTTSNSMSTIPDLSAANSTGSMGLDQRRAAGATAATTTDMGHPANESMSPRSRTRMVVREEMDGVNSTGSSFSDLDDASVTRSALESAFLSTEQQYGGIASRVGNALRSRYLSR
ncbi:hypothetical protein AAP_03308 [Ascosphaera apis ARSEF 7405]|uniref:Autophagy-related protein 29 n=1 Tax=Ascosphaera apis ARSEF 7405 TaxID=392613 RepID=A0A167YPN0_9EURO|nr:hypothetical protein AAP_03308 [Ascosphaera apis ARSEF 7405]